MKIKGFIEYGKLYKTDVDLINIVNAYDKVNDQNMSDDEWMQIYGGSFRT